jgi:predicted nucleic acid-binding protein
MAEAISNTSPLFYLHQIGGLPWLGELFSETWIPNAVVSELTAGAAIGCPVPEIGGWPWLKILDPTYVPSEWLSLDLGAGELSALALGLEHPSRILLLDDALARRVATAAGLTVWGTLRVLLETKRHGINNEIEPLVDRLESSGMWISSGIRNRILALAAEGK